jgi:hypothetical protein
MRRVWHFACRVCQKWGQSIARLEAMLNTIAAALLPMVITVMLGFIAGWHRDFDVKQATVFNRMIMLYAFCSSPA